MIHYGADLFCLPCIPDNSVIPFTHVKVDALISWYRQKKNQIKRPRYNDKSLYWVQGVFFCIQYGSTSVSDVSMYASLGRSMRDNVVNGFSLDKKRWDCGITWHITLSPYWEQIELCHKWNCCNVSWQPISSECVPPAPLVERYSSQHL